MSSSTASARDMRGHVYMTAGITDAECSLNMIPFFTVKNSTDVDSVSQKGSQTLITLQQSTEYMMCIITPNIITFHDSFMVHIYT